MNITRRIFLKLSALVSASGVVPLARAGEAESVTPFTPEFPNLDSLATGKWWLKKPSGKSLTPPMDVPRDQVIAFALYTQDRGVLKLTTQLYPLKPGEPREARLEFQRDGEWSEALKVPVLFPGWSAHFRIHQWDATKDVPYRVRHGEQAVFEGLIRRDPIDKDEIVVGDRFQPPVYSTGTFTVQVGRNRPDGSKLTGLSGQERGAAGQRTISIP